MPTTGHVDEPVLSLAGVPPHLAAWITEIVHAATVSGSRVHHSPGAADAEGDDPYGAARASAGALITAALGVQA